VTQITFGGLMVGSPALVNAAIDKGINLIHLGPTYQRGRTMTIYAEVMKTRRNEVFIGLKQDPVGGIDGSLKALHTDHVDILMPGLTTLDEISNPRLPEAFEKLKKEGKIRFTGYAAHSNVPDVIAQSIELGWYDVILASYNMGNRDLVDPLLERAKRERNMGFMAMKAVKDLKGKPPETVKQAYANYLKNKNLDTLLVGMGSFDDLNTNAEACFEKYAEAPSENLEEAIRYAKANSCSACGACKICPNGVAVCDILRFEGYLSCGEYELALDSYGQLRPQQRADRCQGCGQCTSVCPKSLDIPARLRKVHAALAAYA
jgi:hypothetical protein